MVKGIILRKKGPNKYYVSLKFMNGKEKGKTLTISDRVADEIRENRAEIVNLVNSLLENGSTWDDIFNMFAQYEDLKDVESNVLNNLNKFSKFSEFKTKIITDIIKIMNDVANEDVEDKLVGAKVAAIGDAISYINCDENLKSIINELAQEDKVYIGEGYDYCSNTYAYIVVVNANKPCAVLEIETK